MSIIVLGLVLLAIAQHPFGTYPLSLLLWRFIMHGTAPEEVVSGGAPTSISVLCCCHNEERVIRDKVENLMAAAAHFSGSVQLLFHLDNCTDSTESVLAHFGSAVEVIVSSSQVGKSVGMGKLKARATGELLVYTDANTMIAPDALTRTADAFADPAIGGASGKLTYSNPRDSLTAWINALYWKFEEVLKRLESRVGSTVGADGAFFAIRRELYTPTPPDIIDDLHTSMSVVLGGARFVTLPAVRTFEKTSTDRGDEFRRKVRIACRSFNAYRLLAPRIHAHSLEIAYKFYSHRVMRWLMPTVAAAGLLLVLVGLTSLFPLEGAMISVALLVLLGLGRMRIMPFAPGYEAALACGAVSLGVINSLQGRRFQTWTAAASGR